MCKHILSDMLSGKNESQTSKKMTFQCMKEYRKVIPLDLSSLHPNERDPKLKTMARRFGVLRGW